MMDPNSEKARKNNKMAVIDIRRPHSMSVDKVKDMAEDLVCTLERDFGVDHSWEADNVVSFSCAPKGIKGKLTVRPDELLLNVKLGFLASMFEGRLREEIDDYLRRHLH